MSAISSFVRRHRVALVLSLVYLVLGAALYWPVEPFSTTRIVGQAGSDPVQEVWFLAWAAFALAHAHNPFFSNWLNYPHGVNLAINTSMPLLGVLGAPLTWLRGPVATYDALMRVSFGISAISMYAVCRRMNCIRSAAFLAGLLYGFSPFMIGQSTLR